MKHNIKSFIISLSLILAIAGFVLPSLSFGGCETEEFIIQNKYIGTCGYTQSSTFTLEQDTYITRISIWYDTNIGGNTLSVNLSGPNGYSTNGGKTIKGASQWSWCEGIWSINETLKAGTYTLTADSKSICANPSGLTTLTIYGCDAEEQLPDDTTEGIDPPEEISVLDLTSKPSTAPVYMGNIASSGGNIGTLSGKMELKVNFPAYNQPVDIWILIGLPDGRFYLADEAGDLMSLDEIGFLPIASGASGEKTVKTILQPFDTSDSDTPFNPMAYGIWTVYWLVAPDSSGDIIEALENEQYELGFYIFNVNNSGKPSSGGEVTGPGGSVIHLPTGSSSAANKISLDKGDAAGLVNDSQQAVSDAYKISIADASSVTGDAGYTIDIPLSSPISDPDKLALSVRLTSGTVVPVLGEYDQSANSYHIHLNGLVSGWNMQVVEEPEAEIINGPEAGNKTARHTPRWATTTKWNPCDAWVWRLSAPPKPEEAIFDTDLDSLKSAAIDLCQKYSAMGFREPQMWISSHYGGRVVNIAYNTDGSYYQGSSIEDTPPVDEAELSKLGQIVIDYSTWEKDRFSNYGWLLKNTLAHELFHGIQWGYDIKYAFYRLNGYDYKGIQSFTEGTATAMGMTYQEEGKFTGPDLWVRNGSPQQDILDGYGVSAPFNSGYPTQDFFVYVAKQYGKNSFAYLVDLFEELANQSKVLTPVLLAATYENTNVVYRKAMDISFKRSFKVGLSEVFKTYALDRAYHLTDAGNLRASDQTLPDNKLRADLFKNGVPSSAYSKDNPFKKKELWPLSAAPFRIPAIPETNKISGKLPMVFSITDSSIGADKVRIFVVPEAGGEALTEQIFEVNKLDAPVDIPIVGADSVSVLIAAILTEKHETYPTVTAYIDNNSCSLEEGKMFTSLNTVRVFSKDCNNYNTITADIPLTFSLGPNGSIIPKKEYAPYGWEIKSLSGSWNCNTINLSFTIELTYKNPWFISCRDSSCNAVLTFTGNAALTADANGDIPKSGKSANGTVSQKYNNSYEPKNSCETNFSSN